MTVEAASAKLLTMHALWPLPIVWIDAFGAGVFTMTLVHHLGLWWQRRNRTSYLWIALSALGALMVNLSGLVLRGAQGPPDRFLTSINLFGVALALVSLFELVRSIADKRAGYLRRALQVACIAPVVLYATTGIELLLPLLYALSLAFMVGALLLTLRKSFSDDPQARTLSIGLCALFVTLTYDMASELGLLPRQEGWPVLGFTLLYLAATRAQSLRQLSEHNELLLLRNQLEERVRVRTRELEAANARLDRLSHTDPLTGLPNRRALIEQVGQALQDGGALVMIDIDHFKQINDDFGHDAGDEILRRVAQVLAENFGEHSLIARWGGEEFIAWLPGCRAADAREHAEVARRAVAAIQTRQNHRQTLTASFGVAEVAPGTDFESAVSAADAGLYQAKRDGRNRVQDACAQSPGNGLEGSSA